MQQILLISIFLTSTLLVGCNNGDKGLLSNDDLESVILFVTPGLAETIIGNNVQYSSLLIEKGDVRDVTTQSYWVIDNDDIAIISDDGLATAFRSGTSFIHANYNGLVSNNSKLIVGDIVEQGKVIKIVPNSGDFIFISPAATLATMVVSAGYSLIEIKVNSIQYTFDSEDNLSTESEVGEDLTLITHNIFSNTVLVPRDGVYDLELIVHYPDESLTAEIQLVVDRA